MPTIIMIFCICMAVLLSIGQILFKFAAQDLASATERGLITALLSPWLFAAVALYAVTTVLWVYILTRAPLSQAYPFVLFGMALVPLAAHLFFGEVLSVRFLIGMTLVIAGLTVMHVA
jgi:drug/metabolite transporter (DMT)-like permease